VLLKFPQQVVDTFAEVLFLPLVARLVNDVSAKCRQRVGATLKLLLQQAGPQAIDNLAAFCARWLAGDNTQVRRRAGVCVERGEGGSQAPVPAREQGVQLHAAAAAASSSYSYFSLPGAWLAALCTAHMPATQDRMSPAGLLSLAGDHDAGVGPASLGVCAAS
jgi:hypothetical protein